MIGDMKIRTRDWPEKIPNRPRAPTKVSIETPIFSSIVTINELLYKGTCDWRSHIDGYHVTDLKRLMIHIVYKNFNSDKISATKFLGLMSIEVAILYRWPRWAGEPLART
ncbi:hypothetical protein C2W62_45930 [Candidatus Entotheonella serta]|nr:hypothetical protein C2W62_45930 [Candidatus Entotheonella serta]